MKSGDKSKIKYYYNYSSETEVKLRSTHEIEKKFLTEVAAAANLFKVHFIVSIGLDTPSVVTRLVTTNQFRSLWPITLPTLSQVRPLHMLFSQPSCWNMPHLLHIFRHICPLPLANRRQTAVLTSPDSRCVSTQTRDRDLRHPQSRTHTQAQAPRPRDCYRAAVLCCIIVATRRHSCALSLTNLQRPSG